MAKGHRSRLFDRLLTHAFGQTTILLPISRQPESETEEKQQLTSRLRVLNQQLAWLQGSPSFDK